MLASLAAGGIAAGGDTQPPPPLSDESVSLFDRAIRPITSPTLFDLPVPRSQVHPLFMYQSLPNSVRTVLGDLPVGGDLQVYALQLELALGERFSLVAAKDGYINLSPDATLADADGWANLSAGFKYAFLYRPETGLAAAVNLQVEVPTGNTDVMQGSGDGVAIPSLSFLKVWQRWQLAENLGLRIPFDSGAESTMLHYNVHVSYALTDRLFPLIEASYFRVLDEGDGGRRFNRHVGGLVPGVAAFEGGDLVNLGASNANLARDLVTMGVGFRYRLTDGIDLGVAYEFPLTDEKENLMESRLTVDATIRF